MIITCPNCSARFNVKAELLGDQGRTVKCAKCSHKWFAAPGAGGESEAATPPPVAKKAQPEEPAFDDDLPIPEPPPIPTEEQIAQFQSKPSKKPSTTVYWVALLGFIIVVVGGTLGLRKEISIWFPATEAIYLKLGLVDVLGYGLQINTPDTTSATIGEKRVFTIKGTIENTLTSVLDIPLMRGAVHDTNGKEIYVWSFKADDPRVLPGEKVTYTTEVVNPPSGGTGLTFTFTTEEEAAAEKVKSSP